MAILLYARLVTDRRRRTKENHPAPGNASESESAMVKKTSKPKRAKATPKTERRRKPEILDEEERLLREAFTYLLFNHGMFLVPTAIREMQIKGFPVWIITVTLRYTTGHEGYIGDLLYDGQN